jgi:hypothetical protein
MARLIAIVTAALATLTFTGSCAQAQARALPEVDDEVITVFSGDAYDNEMGIRPRPRADGIIAVLIG